MAGKPLRPQDEPPQPEGARTPLVPGARRTEARATPPRPRAVRRLAGAHRPRVMKARVGARDGAQWAALPESLARRAQAEARAQRATWAMQALTSAAPRQKPQAR